MKRSTSTTIIALCISTILLSSCNKEKERCTGAEETRSSLITDLSVLNPHPEFADTLVAYPQLKVFRIIDDSLLIGIHCRVYHQGLEVISDGYILFKNKTTGSMFSIHDYILPEQSFTALTPSVSSSEAIEIARDVFPIKKRCALYQLALFNVNAGKGLDTRDYKLVWRITERNSGHEVVLDAHTQEVYRKFDGIVY